GRGLSDPSGRPPGTLPRCRRSEAARGSRPETFSGRRVKERLAREGFASRTLGINPGRSQVMNKITLALVMGTGLTLGLTAPARHARAEAIQTFNTPTLSAATFNQDFTP